MQPTYIQFIRKFYFFAPFKWWLEKRCMHANNNNVLCCLFMNCNMTTERLFAECRNFGWGSDFVLISLSHTGSIQNKQKHINFLFGWSVSNDIAKRENQKWYECMRVRRVLARWSRFMMQRTRNNFGKYSWYFFAFFKFKHDDKFGWIWVKIAENSKNSYFLFIKSRAIVSY